jgi:hypothetical protein
MVCRSALALRRGRRAIAPLSARAALRFSRRRIHGKRVRLRQPFARKPGRHRPRITNPWISREAAMTRRLIAIATAIVVTSGCAYAQVGGMGTPSPNSGMGATSPLGMSTSGGVFAPTGIPLGAAPLATPGVSSGSSVGACSPTSTVTGNAMNSTAPFSGDGIGVFGTTTTGTVPMSSNTGLSSNMCGQAPAAGSTTSSQSNATSSNGTSQLGVPTIPMGSTELSNPGLSPAPCPSTGNTAASTSSGAC